LGVLPTDSPGAWRTQRIPDGNSVQGVVERVTFANSENGW
jgi:hypothetical protein